MLEARIAETEAAIREIEQTMAAPGFYDDRAAAQPVIDRHQALMWQVGDLMHQWEELQSRPTCRRRCVTARQNSSFDYSFVIRSPIGLYRNTTDFRRLSAHILARRAGHTLCALRSS